MRIAARFAAILAAVFASALCAEAQSNLPGVWAEIESGGWHTAAKDAASASGGKRVSWFDQKGRAVYVEMNVAQAMPNALVFLRYSGGSGKPLDVSLAACDANGQPGTAKALGQMTLTGTGGSDAYAWASLPAGDLAAGNYRLVFALPEPGGADLDVAGVVADRDNGLWAPPNRVEDGRLLGAGSVAVALLDVESTATGGLLPASGAPTVLNLKLWNHNPREAARLTISGVLVDDGGRVTKLPEVSRELAANAVETVPYEVRPVGAGKQTLTLSIVGVAGVPVRIAYETDLHVVAGPVFWIEGEACQGVGTGGNLPSGGSGGAALFYGWEPKANATVSFPVTLAADMPQALLYFRYNRPAYRDWAGAAATDVYVGPAAAASVTNAGVRKVASTQFELTHGAYLWQTVFLGALPAGAQRIFLVCPKAFGGGDLDILAVLPPIERGLWLPPNAATGGRLSGEGSVRSAAVEVVGSIRTPHLGNLLPGDTYARKPAPFTLTLLNRVVTEPIACDLVGELSDETGVVGKLPAQAVTLAGGETRDVTLAVTAPDYGWYGLKVVATAGGESKPLETAFCVIRPAAQGVRPDSMFGLNVFDGGADDIELAAAMGVKWRRGIPGLKPETVCPKPGAFWGTNEIGKTRTTVQAWKDRGILCLGTVDYNMPWNVAPDPLGRAIQGHENRPRDMAAHVEMVGRMIAPLADEVTNWELWNEPWIHEWTWRTGTAQDYRDFTKLIWERVKPGLPHVNLVGGGSMPFQRDVLFAKGSANAGCVDGVATHPYGIPEGFSAASAALDAHMVRTLSQGKGRGGIWSTEVGTSEFVHYKDATPGAGKATVARSLAPLFVLNRLGAGETPDRIFWFASGFKRGFSGDFLNIWEWDRPKPVVAAYCAASHFLEDATCVGDIYAAARGVWAVHFVKRDRSSVVACWPESGLSGRMTIPAAGCAVFDYLGRSVGEKADGRIAFALRTWETRFIVSAEQPEAVGAALLAATFEQCPALAVNPRSFTQPLDRKPTLCVRVENLLPVGVDAVIEVTSLTPGLTLATARADAAGLAPGEARTVEFALADARPNAINRYPVAWRTVANGVEQRGTQIVQVACATFGTPKIDGDLGDWVDAIPVTLLSRGGKDFTRILMNPNETERLLAAPADADTAVYRLWTRWDEDSFYLAAEVPDQALVSNSTFEDDPYAFPFNADCLQFAFDCLTKNPDDLLAGHALYEKALAADVDYEFCATLARFTGDGAYYANKPAWKGDLTQAPRVPQLHRLRAPGTNLQTWYPTNAKTDPPVGAMQATPEGGPDGRIQIVYDDAKKTLRYELAIPWSAIRELGTRVQALPTGGSLATHFAFAVSDPGGRWRTFWQGEAGDVRSGAYGFSPTWEGGRAGFGGRIVTDWGLVR